MSIKRYHNTGNDIYRKNIENKRTYIIMTLDTISLNITLSKWFLTPRAPYSNP